MAIGPVQLIVLGFKHPNFQGEIMTELERLHENGTVRVLDALAVYKDAEGDLEVEHLSNLAEDGATEVGSAIGTLLISMGFEGEEWTETAAIADAETIPAEGGVRVPDQPDGWDVLEDIPNDSAAVLVLIEHRWASPLRDAIVRADGFRISDGFISPLDLAGIGLVPARGAQQPIPARGAQQPDELEAAGAA